MLHVLTLSQNTNIAHSCFFIDNGWTVRKLKPYTSRWISNQIYFYFKNVFNFLIMLNFSPTTTTHDAATTTHHPTTTPSHPPSRNPPQPTCWAQGSAPGCARRCTRPAHKFAAMSVSVSVPVFVCVLLSISIFVSVGGHYIISTDVSTSVSLNCSCKSHHPYK